MNIISTRKLLAASAALALAVLAFVALPARGNTLGTDIIGMFPKDMSEFAYADMKAARQLPWFSQLQQQMLPANFRQFEQFLRSAGIDPDTQIDELAWGVTAANSPHPSQIAGVALG
ncbi:MAG: hypothetical protein WA020_08165, partial [Candidatus Acidiferrales bacterium]